MDGIASGIEMIMQILPFGGWLAKVPFGIVYGTLLLDALSCFTFLLSKLIFKDSFVSKRIFLSFVGGTALITVFCYVFVTIKTIPLLYVFQGVAGFSYLLPVYHSLTLIAYIFFVYYLINLIVRLVRRGLRKGGDFEEE